MLRCLLLFSLLLSACTSVPVMLQRPSQTDAAFTFNGRLAMKQGSQRDTASVRWVHRADEDEILLLAPLGQTLARIHRDVHESTLDAPGKHYAAQDMETLMQQALGWHLPLAGLQHWVTALPAPGDYSSERAANGQLTVLRQMGWEIDYARYAANTADALPLRMKLQRDGMEVQLVVDEWEAQ